MSGGHIKLGNPGELRDYLLVDPRSYRAQSANPMAPRVNSGGRYEELAGWSQWLQEDWTAGVGRVDVEKGGFLYGNVDARIPRQLIIGPALGAALIYSATDNAGVWLPRRARAYSTLSLTIAGTTTKAAVKVPTGPGTYALSFVAWLVQAAPGTTLTCKICADAAGAPGSVLGTATATTSATTPDFVWVTFDLAYSASADTDYWLTLEGACVLATGEGDVVPGKSYTSSAWATLSAIPFVVCDLWTTANGLGNGVYGFTRNQARLFGLRDQGSPGSHKVVPIEHEELSDAWGTMGAPQTVSGDTTLSVDTSYTGLTIAPGKYLTINAGITATIAASGTEFTVSSETLFKQAPPVLFDGKLYVPLGADLGKLTVADSSGSTATDDASLIVEWSNYLWRAAANVVAYSADGTTWTNVEIGGSDYTVLGLAGMDVDFSQSPMFVANDVGLHYIGSGDAIRGVSPWGAMTDELVPMVNYEGALFIPVGGGLVRFGRDASMMDVWITRDDDLPETLQAGPAVLAGTNHLLLAAVNGTQPSVWGYMTEGWHHVATLPAGVTIIGMKYDRSLQRLWIGCDHGFAFYVGLADIAVNPFTLASSVYAPAAWLETARFYGGLNLVPKDWESISIAGEFASGTSVDVYYQTAENGAWTKLGSVSADGTELRWADYTTRPATTWLRLGLLLRTTDPAVTPRVQGVIVKYLPMITDRWRWTLPILLSDAQVLLDNSTQGYTVGQMWTHLNGLITQVAPVIFEDVDGTQYETKILGAARNIHEYRTTPGGTESVAYVVNLTLEQITNGAYT